MFLINLAAFLLMTILGALGSLFLKMSSGADGITVLLHPVISFPVAVSIIALQLFLLSYIGLLLSTVILVKLLQLENASSPILVVLDGISKLVKLVQ